MMTDVPHHMLRLVFTVGVMVLMALAAKAITALVVTPRRIRYMLRKQGIVGPPPSLLQGNLKEFRQRNASGVPQSPQDMTHNGTSKLFSFMDRWRAEYGSTFLFFFGNIPILYTYNLDIVREITTSTSLKLGKPSYQIQKIGPLVGRGVLTSNGATWVHQRKIIAPELYLDKVKGMVDLIVDSSVSLLDTWIQMIREQGGKIDITIDKHMRSFSGDVISRACFGSNYAKGEEIFLRLRGLQQVLSKNSTESSLPGLKYIPSRRNNEIWKMEKEVRSLILDVVNERSRMATPENDLLQKILKGARNSDFSRDDMDRFIVDNCKNIYLAGYETTAVSASWTLMLLASSPEWQRKVRAEVTELCGGQLPDANTIGKMKVLAMVINESLRLYPPVTTISREALEDVRFGDLHVPKGFTVWAPVATMHLDREIWGPDAEQFNPERFVNGVSKACKLPHVFMPFGVGPRVCLGQNLAMWELKILIAMIVSKFSLSLSPRYKHSPTLRLLLEPEFGVDLIVEAL